ncbi:hypothetical protein DPMN_033653 [Dreissena polymorpha]|uniref:Uncharacterized protein n=1 Tax=Dreissena polymorpha TaxID=45954 RepID=A0A9D4RLC3_DREPO|nr:hypothetical protein DPMN_033653 [Dreissena polymorpha]
MHRLAKKTSSASLRKLVQASCEVPILRLRKLAKQELSASLGKLAQACREVPVQSLRKLPPQACGKIAASILLIEVEVGDLMYPAITNNTPVQEQQSIRGSI